MTRRIVEVAGGIDDASDDALDRLASAVHTAAHWLPPWSDPLHLVIAAGFEAVVCTPVTGMARGRRRVSFEWHPDDAVRGLRVLRGFAEALLVEILGENAATPARVDALAARLLVPSTMVGAARRDPCQPSRIAPSEFVAARIASVPPSKSGTFAVAYAKR